jgi:hypothetical protein
MTPVGSDWSAWSPEGAVGSRVDARLAALALGEPLLPPTGDPSLHAFEVRCADVHSGASRRRYARNSPAMLSLACEHGALVHGFTPAWYSPDRLAAIEER